MGSRTIATISSFLTEAPAREFVDNYNEHTTGCFSAELHIEAEDGAPIVLMLEHDTAEEAAESRGVSRETEPDDADHSPGGYCDCDSCFDRRLND